MNKLLSCAAVAFIASSTFAQTPPADAFRVLPPPAKYSAVISDLLKYQTEIAWDQDAVRRKRWEAIRTEEELLALQDKMRQQLLKNIGGLPEVKTPLHPRITGRVQMDGWHIEKLIYESLPGIYVPALVYVPDDGVNQHPSVLVPSGHSPKGKFYYQALCQRLVRHGYVVIAWDPVGQGERSQFWDVQTQKSRYNLICAEHAVMGNLAYLAGTNLARWEIWDGIRAVDYLLTRSDVDPTRINITGSSGGGTQTAYIAAIDKRIRAAVPSCYITALPMRIYNRIFKDPDSDPEQDIYGMMSDGIDHPGLLLLMYPRPVFVAAAVLDFFPIEGTHKSVREVESLYAKFGHADRIGMHEGYHDHQYSIENQEFAIAFLDHFNGIHIQKQNGSSRELDEKTLQCSRSGQVMVDFEDARSIMDEIRDYYEQHKSDLHLSLRELYYSSARPHIEDWNVKEDTGAPAGLSEIRWQSLGTTRVGDISVDRYLLHYSRYLKMPMLWIHRGAGGKRRVLVWLEANGKATAQDWPELRKQIDSGFDVVSFDPRGLGESRMPYIVESPDDPALANRTYEQSYTSPISGVLADYSYNAILTGRPLFLQMIEDVDIASRFAREKLNADSKIWITGTGTGMSIADAAASVLPGVQLIRDPQSQPAKWSDLVKEKRETWPIELLLPGGAYIR